MPRKRGASTQQKRADGFGQRLARFRKERGLSQLELAERLGIAQPNLSDYERGAARPSYEILVKLVRVLQVSADELLGFRGSPAVPILKDRRLLHHMQQIEALPKRKKDALLVTIRAFLVGSSVRHEAESIAG